MSEASALFTDGELGPAPSSVSQAAFDAWNEIAAKAGWPKALKLTPDRAKRLQKAVKEAGGLVNWRGVLERAGRSSFLTGRTGRSGAHENWVMDLEFVCRPAKLLKIMEGAFDDKVAAPAVDRSAGPSGVDWRSRLHKYRKGGFWPASWSNRPETPGPWLAGPVHVAEWRKAHGVEEPQALAETAEQRLEASIASLRRVGQYDRANAAEEKLARLQGRPPVLVPHPESASIGMPPKAPISRPMPKMTDIEAEPMPAPPDWVDEAPPPNPNDYE